MRPDENPELFELTLGGMGLTGLHRALTLQLPAPAGPGVRRTVVPVGDLVEAVDVMTARRDNGARPSTRGTTSTAGGGGSGGGWCSSSRSTSAARPAAGTAYRRLEPGRRGPRAPGGRPPGRGGLNPGYRTRERLRPGDVRSVEDAAFPINGSEVYYRLFGRQGFREYQLVVPTEAWADARARDRPRRPHGRRPGHAGVAQAVRRRAPPAVVPGQDGVCLALDAPEGEAARRLFAGSTTWPSSTGAS